VAANQVVLLTHHMTTKKPLDPNGSSVPQTDNEEDPLKLSCADSVDGEDNTNQLPQPGGMGLHSITQNHRIIKVGKDL